MKHVRESLNRTLLSLVFILGAGTAWNSKALMQPAEAVIKDFTGNASYSVAGTWQPLRKNMKLSQGAIVRTEAGSTADLLFHSSGTALRLTPDSSLRLDQLKKEAGGEMLVTETTVTLLSGSVAGTQRKLAAPSRFKINVARGVATIVGTEYLVRADGAVTVLSGTVSINYNVAGKGGSVKVSVSAGFSFDPATGQVVPTTAAYLQNIIADINTTKQNAETFKIGKATLVVKPEKVVSPHGSDDEHENGHGNDDRQGHDE